MIIDDLQSVQNLLYLERTCGRDYMSKAELDKIGSQLKLVAAIIAAVGRDVDDATIKRLGRHPEALAVVEMVEGARDAREAEPGRKAAAYAIMAAQRPAPAPSGPIGCNHAL